MDDRRKRLLYRATHRGMKETDALIGGYAARHLSGLSDAELDEFEAVLNESDNDLMNWILEREPLANADLSGMVRKLITYRKSLSP